MHRNSWFISTTSLDLPGLSGNLPCLLQSHKVNCSVHWRKLHLKMSYSRKGESSREPVLIPGVSSPFPATPHAPDAHTLTNRCCSPPSGCLFLLCFLSHFEWNKWFGSCTMRKKNASVEWYSQLRITKLVSGLNREKIWIQTVQLPPAVFIHFLGNLVILVFRSCYQFPHILTNGIGNNINLPWLLKNLTIDFLPLLCFFFF